MSQAPFVHITFNMANYAESTLEMNVPFPHVIQLIVDFLELHAHNEPDETKFVSQPVFTITIRRKPDGGVMVLSNTMNIDLAAGIVYRMYRGILPKRQK